MPMFAPRLNAGRNRRGSRDGFEPGFGQRGVERRNRGARERVVVSDPGPVLGVHARSEFRDGRRNEAESKKSHALDIFAQFAGALDAVFVVVIVGGKLMKERIARSCSGGG